MLTLNTSWSTVFSVLITDFGNLLSKRFLGVKMIIYDCLYHMYKTLDRDMAILWQVSHIHIVFREKGTAAIKRGAGGIGGVRGTGKKGVWWRWYLTPCRASRSVESFALRSCSSCSCLLSVRSSCWASTLMSLATTTAVWRSAWNRRHSSFSS